MAGALGSDPRVVLDDNDPALFPKLTDEQLALLAPHGRVQPKSSSANNSPWWEKKPIEAEGGVQPHQARKDKQHGLFFRAGVPAG